MANITANEWNKTNKGSDGSVPIKRRGKVETTDKELDLLNKEAQRVMFEMAMLLQLHIWNDRIAPELAERVGSVLHDWAQLVYVG